MQTKNEFIRQLGFAPPVCPRFQNTVLEVARNTQAPEEMVWFSALSALAVAIQGSVDVMTPARCTVPTSLMVLINASSGERKSTVENKLYAGIRELEEELSQQYQCNYQAWTVEKETWSAKRRGLVKAIDQGARKGEDTSALENAFKAHMLIEPMCPRKKKLLYEDATSAALFAGLYENFPYAGLVSSEGSSILGGAAFNDLSKQNALWSGDVLTVDRASTLSFTLRNARLSVSVMVQPAALEKYKDVHGEQARGSGLWARFLVSNPASTQGQRYIESQATPEWNHCDQFSERIRNLLRVSIALAEGDGVNRTVLKLSRDAEAAWIGKYNWIESLIGPGGFYEHTGDHASKILENIARVAALLHVFEGFEGDISLDTLNLAILICDLSSFNFMSLMLPRPQEEVDAETLNQWLNEYRAEGFVTIEKNTIRQGGPNMLRNKERLNKALLVLHQKGAIVLMCQGRKQVVNLSGRLWQGWGV